MDGYILILLEGAMPYPKVESYPTIYWLHTSTGQVVLKLQQTQGYGNKPGVQFDFALSLMNLEFNMWGGKHTHHLRQVLQEHDEISE